jgi:tetratricopeptide (TPR) repeat protein
MTAPRVSLAQDDAAVNEAYTMAAQGIAAFNDGQFAEALDKYTRAFSIVRLPALAVHMARADVKLGRLVAAADLYQQALQLGDGIGAPKVQARARAEAQVERAALLLRIPKLLIRVMGAPPARVKVQVDGATFPPESFESGYLVDPGTHNVTAAFGTQEQEQMAAMAEGAVRELLFAFQPTASPAVAPKPSSPEVDAERGTTSATRTAAWVSFGVGGTGLLFWGTTGLVALSKSNHLKSLNCGGSQPPCPQDEKSSYGTWKALAGVGFYTGAAGLLTGAALLIAEPSKKKSRDSGALVLPWLGVGTAGVEGQF